MNPLAKEYKKKLKKTREEIVEAIRGIITRHGDMTLSVPCKVHVYRGRFQQAATVTELCIRQLDLLVVTEEYGAQKPADIKTNDLVPLLDAVEETAKTKS